jgi:CubicO group peptidase (beta-lactamase class C family)
VNPKPVLAAVLAAAALGGAALAAPSLLSRNDGPAAGAPPSPAAPRAEAAAPPPTRGLDRALLDTAYAQAARLPRLRSLLVARDGEILAERYFHGARAERAANVKSVSKSIVSALVGIAVAEGHLRGPEQPIAPFFPEHLARDPDPRKRAITVGNLLSMQAGLESTSFGNYGAWVGSRDWVRFALARPMEDEPGGRMLYSTGSTHLLSAILTEATGRSTWAYARDVLAEPLGIRLPQWPTDPQGIYFGGNEMRLTPRAMVRFGELYRNGGRHEGRQVVPEAWVRASLQPRTRSPWSGDEYGYGWWLSTAGGHPMYYAWGYGGQFIFVVPDLRLTVVTTSEPDLPREGGHLEEIRRILRTLIVPAAEEGGPISVPDTLPAGGAG